MESVAVRRLNLYERLGDVRGLCATNTNLAALILTRRRPAKGAGAPALLLAAEAATETMNLPAGAAPQARRDPLVASPPRLCPLGSPASQPPNFFRHPLLRPIAA